MPSWPRALVPSCLCGLVLFMPFVPLCPRETRPYVPSCLHALLAFAPYVLYLRALSTCLARIFHAFFAPYAPYLCAFKSFLDEFIVQQKFSIFQRLLKALQIVLFLYGSKNSRDTFKRGNLLSIFKT